MSVARHAFEVLALKANFKGVLTHCTVCYGKLLIMPRNNLRPDNRCWEILQEIV